MVRSTDHAVLLNSSVTPAVRTFHCTLAFLNLTWLVFNDTLSCPLYDMDVPYVNSDLSSFSPVVSFVVFSNMNERQSSFPILILSSACDCLELSVGLCVQLSSIDSPTKAELADDHVVGAAGGVPIGIVTLSVGSDVP